jgi:hypothetical protein
LCKGLRADFRNSTNGQQGFGFKTALTPCVKRPLSTKELKEMSSVLNINGANNEEYCIVMMEDVDEVLETMRIKEEPPSDNKMEPIETFVESENATDSKGFEALHNIVLNIDDQFLCSDV